MNFTYIDKVKSYISNTETVFHQSAYELNTPASPHLAAANDNVTIELDKIIDPNTNNHLVIEGAGGIFVSLVTIKVLLIYTFQLSMGKS